MKKETLYYILFNVTGGVGLYLLAEISFTLALAIFLVYLSSIFLNGWSDERRERFEKEKENDRIY